MRTCGLFLIFFLAIGCSTLSPSKDSEKIVKDQGLINEVIKKCDEGPADACVVAAQNFQKTRSDSVYFQASRLEEARGLEGLAQASEAQRIYIDVRDKTLSEKPELAARAEWRLSSLALVAGDDMTALAHVLSAEKLAKDLDESVAAVEVPARKGLIFHRLGRAEDAEKSIEIAERGLRALLSGPREKPSARWLAKLYLQMGQAFITPVDAENFLNVLRAERISQKYLLQAIELDQPQISTEALETLKSNSNLLWNAIDRMALAPGEIDLRSRRRRQIPLMSEFLRVLDEGARRGGSGSETGSTEREAQKYIADLSGKIRKFLYSDAETTVLTEESHVLNRLRRDGLKLVPVEGEKAKNDPNL